MQFHHFCLKGIPRTPTALRFLILYRNAFQNQNTVMQTWDFSALCFLLVTSIIMKSIFGCTFASSCMCGLVHISKSNLWAQQTMWPWRSFLLTLQVNELIARTKDSVTKWSFKSFCLYMYICNCPNEVRVPLESLSRALCLAKPLEEDSIALNPVSQ